MQTTYTQQKGHLDFLVTDTGENHYYVEVTVNYGTLQGNQTRNRQADKHIIQIADEDSLINAGTFFRYQNTSGSGYLWQVGESQFLKGRARSDTHLNELLNRLYRGYCKTYTTTGVN